MKPNFKGLVTCQGIYISFVPNIVLGKQCWRKEKQYQKITDELEFESSKISKQERDFIMNSVIYGKDVIDSISYKFHYMICQKKLSYKKYICDPVNKIANLQMVLKKY